MYIVKIINSSSTGISKLAANSSLKPMITAKMMPNNPRDTFNLEIPNLKRDLFILLQDRYAK